MTEFRPNDAKGPVEGMPRPKARVLLLCATRSWARCPIPAVSRKPSRQPSRQTPRRPPSNSSSSSSSSGSGSSSSRDSWSGRGRGGRGGHRHSYYDSGEPPSWRRSKTGAFAVYLYADIATPTMTPASRPRGAALRLALLPSTCIEDDDNGTLEPPIEQQIGGAHSTRRRIRARVPDQISRGASQAASPVG
jgi:hypothetical protein